jgi:hypoxanthine-DNA glycosylase
MQRFHQDLGRFGMDESMSIILHNLPPIYNSDSEVLILGSFPSVKSRKAKFYYENPQNRFWLVVASVFEQDVPRTTDEKRAFLLRNRIALWDVIASCEIAGSSDQTIRNPVPNDLTPILTAAEIKRIFANGRKAEEYFNKLISPNIGRNAVYLPSTSPANAAVNLDQLVQAWKAIRQKF